MSPNCCCVKQILNYYLVKSKIITNDLIIDIKVLKGALTMFFWSRLIDDPTIWHFFLSVLILAGVIVLITSAKDEE